MQSFDVGRRLAAVRQSASLSQRSLAKRAGIANSTISLIESNHTNPSVGALKRILDAVPIGLAEFFAGASEIKPAIFFPAVTLTEISRAPLSFRQVGANLDGRALQILDEHYAPGADTGRIPYSHGGEEGGIVISGRIEVTVDGERCILGPGDAYYFDSGKPHRFRCLSDAPCHVVSACTPPSF